jgi:anion-transporting  ArsA/GET3 family ATPase
VGFCRSRLSVWQRGVSFGFVLVSSPEEEVLEEAEYLSDKMTALGMPLRAVVLNRVHHEFTAPIDRDDFPRGDIRGEDAERVTACLRRSCANRRTDRRVSTTG